MGDEGEPHNFKLASAIDDMRKGFVKETGSDPALRLTHERSACNHDGTLDIDEKAGTVTCGECGRLVDPFDALVLISRKEKRMQRQYDEIMRERRQQRGFYEKKKTVKARRCKHTNTFKLNNGQQKCCSCDTVLDSQPINKGDFSDGRGTQRRETGGDSGAVR